MREGPADRGNPALDRVFRRGHGNTGARFGLAVHDYDLAHVHLCVHFLHHLDWAGGTGHDTGAEGPQVILGKVRVGELGDEHGRDPMECCAVLFLDGF